MKTKLAIVITRFLPGGASQVVKNIIDYGREEFDFTLYTGREGISDREKEDLSEKYNVVFINSLVRRISPLKDYLAYLALKKCFRDGKFDIVHTHTSKAGFIGRFAAKSSGVKMIVHSAHGSIYFPKSKIPGVPDINLYKKILLKAEKMLAPFTDFQIVLSRSEYDFSVKTGLSKPKSTLIIPNGILLEDFSFSQDEKKRMRKEFFPHDEGAKILLCLGRLSSEKGQGLLIEAFMSLLDEHKIPNLKLVFVGDGPERKNLEKKAGEFIGKNKIIFAGYSSVPHKYLAAADIFIQPSLYEGFGLSLIEAMASELPCIASDAGGIPEIITDMDNGLLFSRGDLNKLKEKIIFLFKSPDIAAKIAAQAKKSVKKYDLRTTLNGYYKIYRDIKK